MTAPASDIPWNVFGDREVTRAGTWYARVFDFINRCRDAAEPMGLAWRASRQGAAVSVPDAAWTAINLDTIHHDTDSVGISGGGFVAPAAGLYLIGGAFGFGDTGSLRQGCQIGITSAGTIDGAQRIAPRAASSQDGVAAPTTIVELAAGDNLVLFGYHDGNGGTARVTTTSTGLAPCMTVVRIRG